MQCPYCGGDKSGVVDSRVARDQSAIRRRRQCDKCARRFTTYERVEMTLPTVVKRDGRSEPFQVTKLRAGVALACQKRRVPADKVDELITAVERHFAELPAREVDSSDIGEAVLTRLRKLDEVAYVRFASVYRVFSDVNQFVTELETLQESEDEQPPKP